MIKTHSSCSSRATPVACGSSTGFRAWEHDQLLPPNLNGRSWLASCAWIPDSQKAKVQHYSRVLEFTRAKRGNMEQIGYGVAILDGLGIFPGMNER
jgi:hypothetical protein